MVTVGWPPNWEQMVNNFILHLSGSCGTLDEMNLTQDILIESKVRYALVDHAKSSALERV